MRNGEESVCPVPVRLRPAMRYAPYTRTAHVARGAWRVAVYGICHHSMVQVQGANPTHSFDSIEHPNTEQIVPTSHHTDLPAKTSNLPAPGPWWRIHGRTQQPTTRQPEHRTRHYFPNNQQQQQQRGAAGKLPLGSGPGVWGRGRGRCRGCRYSAKRARRKAGCPAFCLAFYISLAAWAGFGVFPPPGRRSIVPGRRE
jgi:hypothetical protein